MNKQISQNEAVQDKCICAVEGEQVWVLLNHVKAERRKEFERFMHEIIAPIAERSEPDVLKRTRILHPAGPNEDGTYTYIFLMDPVAPEGEYDLGKLLALAYPPEQSEELGELFTGSLASPQVEYKMTQVTW